MISARTIPVFTDDSRRRSGRFALLVLLLLAGGCNNPKSPVDADPQPADHSPLRVLVVGDSLLATTLDRQWAAEGEGEISLRSLAAADLPDQAVRLAADVVIYPNSLLGRFAESRLIAPVPASLWGDPNFDRGDLLRSARTVLCQWGGETYAVPLGSPHWMLAYRPDLLAEQQIEPPANWTEYAEAAALLSKAPTERAEGPWHGCIEPLGPFWRSAALLARAAGYARHRGGDAGLFDIATMQPLINTPPFVRALEELKAAAAHMPADVLELSPRDVLNRFLQGQTALAITWPSRALVAERVAAAGSPTPIKLALCPGSQEVYHRFRERWFARNSEDSPQVPLLGVTGRLASISRESSRAQQAARFLIWLTERRSSVDLLRDNPDAAPFRASHLENAGRWLPPDFSEQQSQDYAELVKSIEDSSLYLVYPRIPGQQKYLDALDDAIQQAITGQQSPREALDEAAEKWRQLTESLGSEAQHSAVRKHLGRSF